MDDNVSHDSDDSVLTSDEFEIIHTTEPKLNIAGNGNLDDLEQSLSEVLMDSEMPGSANKIEYSLGKGDSGTIVSDEKVILNKLNNEKLQQKADEIDMKVLTSEAEIIKSDSANEISAIQRKNKPPNLSNVSDTNEEEEEEDEDDDDDSITKTDTTLFTVSPSPSEEGNIGRLPSLPNITMVGEECTLFHHVTYLGCATINAPRSKGEIQRNMAILNAQPLEHAIEVTISVPTTSEGTVVLFEPNSSTEIASYKIHRILYCACGPPNSPEAICFAFTCSHGDAAATTIFQCHVFKCDIPEVAGRVVICFVNAFQRVPPHLVGIHKPINRSMESSMEMSQSKLNEVFLFEVTLEIREEDSKGNFTACPKDKTYFKLRSNVMKKVIITVQQVSSNRELNIERCFGLLVSPGRNVRNGDMNLLETVIMSVSSSGDHKIYTITGQWDPSDPAFEVLNTETTKDMRVYMTVAVDLVLTGIQEPVRFWLETKAKIFPQNDRFWYFTRKQLTEQFHLQLKEIESQTECAAYKVMSLESGGELERRRLGLSLNLRNTLAYITPPIIQTPVDPEEDSDNDEPLLSGSGEVSKDCSEGELESWAEVLNKWSQSFKQRPRQLLTLVRKGIPEALRGEVWQRLSGVHDNPEMMDTYRILITKDSPCEQVILRDINRTFPAHDYFKETGGIGQDSLYKISKAYSVYDEEVGYCQGLSFLAAALLLHMPEEQAFCVLVKIMFDYHLRDLFRDNFIVLHTKFYQLERLIEDQIPELHSHFHELGVEAHMFGSQWFLTLFTAKFPLFLVFHILDIFLCEGMDTIFQVALALLLMSKKELLALDFEGILKYFRVSLPKKYRNEEIARQLLRQAVAIKIKKLKKYEKEYQVMKEQERQQENPLERLERENKRLLEANMRLEQENDDLAHELVTSKIELRNDLDMAEDKADILNKELLSAKSLLVDTEEEKKRLEVEAAQLKEMCRRELQSAESENSRNVAIIADYKQICSQLSSRLEKEQLSNKEALVQLKDQIKDCCNCSKLIGDTTQLIPRIKSMGDKADPELAEALQQVRELELELAQTKLDFVEAQCRNQDLTHQLNAALSELQSTKSTWFQKTLTSIREATKKDPNVRESPREAT